MCATSSAWSSEKGQLSSRFPPAETAKGIAHVVEDLSSGRVKVKDIYDAADRAAYAKKLPTRAMPARSRALSAPVELDALATGAIPSTQRAKPTTHRKRPVRPRTALVPANSRINPQPPRINAIYNELASLSVDQYPNACSVSLRVFLELSVDHYIDDKKLMTETERNQASLAKRMKKAAQHLKDEGKIPDQLRKAVDKIANSQDVIAASAFTFNQFVHNQFVYPKPSELHLAWDELQPFLEKLLA